MTELSRQSESAERGAERVLVQNPVLRKKIQDSCDVSEEGVIELLVEVLRFLQLIAETEKILSPSHRVDLAWHEFILCTRAYEDFCQKQFGRMIHHTPGGDPEKNQDQFHQTLALYRTHFGPPPANFWGKNHSVEAADCGPCEGSGSPSGSD